jgi:hypothetical protein
MIWKKQPSDCLRNWSYNSTQVSLVFWFCLPSGVNGVVAIGKLKDELHLETIVGLRYMVLYYAAYGLNGKEMNSSFRT